MNIRDGFTVTAQQPVTETEIETTGYPTIDPKHCRESMRIEGTVTATKLRSALINAILRVQSDLDTWLKEQNKSFNELTIDSAQVDGQSVKSILFRQAVYCYAVAEIAERLNAYDATSVATKREPLNSITTLNRDAISAIRQIMGKSIGHAELI